MPRIYKYELQIEDSFWVEMPLGAKPVFVGVQVGASMDGKPMLWAEIDTKHEKREYLFHCVGTGHAAPYLSKYVGTVQIGEYVWHFYTYPEKYQESYRKDK